MTGEPKPQDASHALIHTYLLYLAATHETCVRIALASSSSRARSRTAICEGERETQKRTASARKTSTTGDASSLAVPRLFPRDLLHTIMGYTHTRTPTF